MKESNEEWIIMKQGAEAKIYQGKFMGRQAVLKERFVKGYRHPSLDLNLTKERIKSEVRALARCRSIGRSFTYLHTYSQQVRAHSSCIVL